VEANNPARSAARRIVPPAGRAHSGGAGSDGFEFCSRNRRLCAHLGSLIVPFHLCAKHLLKHLAIALSFDGFLCRAFGEWPGRRLPVTLLIRADEFYIGQYVAPHCSLNLRFRRVS
jgi:hypothetical protein